VAGAVGGKGAVISALRHALRAVRCGCQRKAVGSVASAAGFEASGNDDQAEAGEGYPSVFGDGAFGPGPFSGEKRYFVRVACLSLTSIDLFDFDFKIPKGMADYDAKEIQVWGRGYSDVSRYEDPVSSWLPEWASGLDGVNRLFLALAVSGVVLLALFAVWALWKKRKDMADYLHVAGTLTVCFLFWLLTAPLIRYGCIFLWLTAVLTWGCLYLKLSPHTDRFIIYMLLVCALGIYKLGAFGGELYRQASLDYLVLQKDYENYKTVSYELHGYTFYYPEQGDQTGYQDFPASPQKAEDIFRGETIEEGFKDIIHS